MRFFIPPDLVKSQWVKPKTKQQDNQPQEDNKPRTGYEDDLLWAWCACRFGWLPEEFARLTPLQKRLLQTAEHDRAAEEQMLMDEAVANALTNGFKKKGSEPELLWVQRSSKSHKNAMSAAEAKDKMRALEKALSNKRNK